MGLGGFGGRRENFLGGWSKGSRDGASRHLTGSIAYDYLLYCTPLRPNVKAFLVVPECRPIRMEINSRELKEGSFGTHTATRTLWEPTSWYMGSSLATRLSTCSRMASSIRRRASSSVCPSVWQPWRAGQIATNRPSSVPLNHHREFVTPHCFTTSEAIVPRPPRHGLLSSLLLPLEGGTTVAALVTRLQAAQLRARRSAAEIF